eukprot:scaffold645601_cov46-Prasinocladus_malaysianus.AAC.1
MRTANFTRSCNRKPAPLIIGAAGVHSSMDDFMRRLSPLSPVISLASFSSLDSALTPVRLYSRAMTIPRAEL